MPENKQHQKKQTTSPVCTFHTCREALTASEAWKCLIKVRNINLPPMLLLQNSFHNLFYVKNDYKYLLQPFVSVQCSICLEYQLDILTCLAFRSLSPL